MPNTPAMTSRSEKAASRSVFDIRDVVRAALAAIGTKGHDLIGREMIDGRAITVGMTPGIERHPGALEISPVPILDFGRPLGDGVKPLPTGQVAARIHLKELHSRPQPFHLHL